MMNEDQVSNMILRWVRQNIFYRGNKSLAETNTHSENNNRTITRSFNESVCSVCRVNKNCHTADLWSVSHAISCTDLLLDVL